jgi:type III secretory pathway component EscS
MNIQINDIGHVIQLAIAPVFLLTGVATKLGVLTNRLARVIDRTRVLEDRLDIGHSDPHMTELRVLYIRMHLINYAIALSTFCGLLICLVIAMLFLGDTTDLPLDKIIAAFFVVATFSLIGSFVCLLREIFVASRSMRYGRHTHRSKRTRATDPK